jgi:hypothetical protein
MPHGGLVPGQPPFRLAVLAKLGLQKTGAASRILRPVGRWQGPPAISYVQERLEPDVFPHLLEHIGQPYSWGPQPSIHRRVHAEWLVLLSGAEMWNLVRGCSRALQDFRPFYHTK